MARSIKLLDDNTINKIAAGEVVERPSSVVKELLENSIDANSTSITIDIKEGGKSYIRITDNGDGIDRGDIDLAFLRHSTSKILKAEDLSFIETLGFRGEALASIASVSQVELITKTSKDISGISALVSGGMVKSKTDIGCPKGTTIIVRNLFFNTPVRQKFLKADTTEASYISDIIYKLSISNPDISFNYVKDNKTIIRTPGRGDIETTVYSVLGKDFIDYTFKLNSCCEAISLSGFIGKLSYTRSNRNSQYIFINGRYIRDSGISKVIEDSYSTLLTTKRYPVFLLFISLDTSVVDVNVHPTKTEVRFTNREALYKFIASVVKEVLYSENLIPRVDFSNSCNKSKETTRKTSASEEQVFLDSVAKTPKTNINIDDSILKVLDFNTTDDLSVDTNISNKIDQIKDVTKDKIRSNSFDKLNESSVYEKVNESICDNYSSHDIVNNTRVPNIIVVGTLFNTYILGQDSENKLFYMIDQHAAHERVMYEKLKTQFLNQEINTQILLNTEVLELSLKDIDLVKNNMSVFSDLGFDIEEFGTNTIALRGVPLVFGNPNSKELFLEILDNLDNNPISNYEFKLERIMKIACTSAIKAKDNMEGIEIEKLMDDLKKTKEPFTCPHGRPIIIEMSKYEIERKFKRV